MEKARLKKLRTSFREGVFARDKSTCIFCNKPAADAHHITDRSEMPNGGYVLENGASLCHEHHFTAEQFHMSSGLFWIKGYSPSDLYEKIGSSYEKALDAAKKL